MVYDFNGKTVVVTGASKGIGRELSIAMVGRGATVIGTARSTELLEDIRKSAQSLSGSFLPYTADLLKDEDVKGLISEILKNGGAHTIVLNAGVFEQNYFPATKSTKKIYRVNTESPVEFLRMYMSSVIESKPNNPLEMVATILSESGIKPYPGSVVYSGSKMGLLFNLIGVEEELSEERDDETKYGRRYKSLFRNTRFRYVYFSSVRTGIWDESKENSYGSTDMWVKIPLEVAIKYGLMAIDGTYEPNHVGVLTDYNNPTNEGYPVIIEGYRVVRDVAPTIRETPRVDFQNPVKREVVAYFEG